MSGTRALRAGDEAIGGDGAPAAKLGAVALGTIGQTGQESVVSLSLPASEQIAKELGMKIKGPDWREVMKAELDALGPNAGVSLIYSIVAAAGAPVARHTNRAELKRALQDRHGLELAGFDPQAVDAVVKAAASDPEKAADLLHASWQETSVEKRRANAEAKLEAMQAPGEQGKPGAGTQVAEGDPAGVPAVPEAEAAGGGEKSAPAFEPDEELVNRAVEEAVARGNMASTDDVRPLLPGYGDADPLTRETAFHKQAGTLNGEVIKRLLARKPVNHVAILLAGGPGSGKTSVLRKFKIPSDLVVDTMLAREKRARLLIDQIRASGREVVVAYVHRPFAAAFEGNIQRYLEGKESGEHRLVPLRIAAESHVGAQETALALADRGITVDVLDNSGPAGGAIRKDIGFLKAHRYTTNHGRGNEGEARGGAENAGGDEGKGDSRVGRSTAGGPGRSREQAAAVRLIAEGDAILERYRREGKLTDAEVRAFRGEGGGTDDSPDGGGSAPPDGGGDVPGPSNRTAAPPGSGGDARRADLPSPEDGRQPAIRRLTSLGTGQEVHVFEAPDGTRSEHATRDEARDAYDTWEAEQEYQDWIGERLSKTRKKAKDMGAAGDLAIGDRIVERLMRKSFAVRGKGPVRKALFGERLAMTPEEIRTLRSPVEILLRYTPEGKFHSARRGSRVDHNSPAMIQEGEIFCHNHPGGRGPSDGDLKFALENPTCTVRVIARSQKGRGEIYQIRARESMDRKVKDEIRITYREHCERLGDDAGARRRALGLIVSKFGDFISVQSQQL